MNKLTLFNAALRICGEGKLASLSENREPRRVLDSMIEEGALDHCLSQGMWRFATRTTKLVYSPSLETSFGLRYVFEEPEDFCKTVALCSDEFFNCPLLQYRHEAGFIYADIQEIYFSYVSNHVDYGMDYEKWKPTFTQYVAHYLATGICERMTQNESKYEKLFKLTKRYLTEAKSLEAWEEPTKFLPQGEWVSSRRSGRGNDFGNRNKLIG